MTTTAATSKTTKSAPTGDDEKSHTFRKRRLSLSRHNIGLDSDVSAAGGSCSVAAAEAKDEGSLPGSVAASSSAAAPVAALDESEAHADGEGDAPPVPVVTTTTPPPSDDIGFAGGDGEPNGVTDAVKATTATITAATATAAGASPNEEETSVASDQKAQTFRKRRLSLTLKPPTSATDVNAAGAAFAAEDSNNQNHEGGMAAEVVKEQSSIKATPEEPVKRQCRDSNASLSSFASDSCYNTEGSLRVRTLHAGEIVRPHSPVPTTQQHSVNATATTSNPTTASATPTKREPHVLYRQSRPSSLSLLQHEDLLSHKTAKWKKRIVRKHDEDERKLPFPRHVVGTYSCHGVEPVYDSDYDDVAISTEHEDEGYEDEDGHNWTTGVKTLPTDADAPSAATVLPITAPIPISKPSTAAKINQDRGGVAFPYGNCSKTALFAAYDGHGQGGELVSQFALHEIQSRLENRPDFNTDLENAFKETFLAVDEALQEEPLIEPLYAGTTACVVLLRELTLTVANAGDSRAVVARKQDGREYRAIDLTVDQNPDLPEERSRIESMGGFVSPPPEPGLSARVWLDEGFSQIGLAMARSIGDHAVARVGVIAEPVVTQHTVSPEDHFLIIATDGVWEFVSSQDAVEIVASRLAQGKGATKATQALIEAAAARWHDEEGDYRDDITALVVRLNELWKDGSESNKVTKIWKEDDASGGNGDIDKTCSDAGDNKKDEMQAVSPADIAPTTSKS